VIKLSKVCPRLLALKHPKPAKLLGPNHIYIYVYTVGSDPTSTTLSLSSFNTSLITGSHWRDAGRTYLKE
jgi:hypothetical protein